MRREVTSVLRARHCGTRPARPPVRPPGRPLPCQGRDPGTPDAAPTGGPAGHARPGSRWPPRPGRRPARRPPRTPSSRCRSPGRRGGRRPRPAAAPPRGQQPPRRSVGHHRGRPRSDPRRPGSPGPRTPRPDRSPWPPWPSRSDRRPGHAIRRHAARRARRAAGRHRSSLQAPPPRPSRHGPDPPRVAGGHDDLGHRTRPGRPPRLATLAECARRSGDPTPNCSNLEVPSWLCGRCTTSGVVRKDPAPWRPHRRL